jgi:hypothetical protein
MLASYAALRATRKTQVGKSKQERRRKEKGKKKEGFRPPLSRALRGYWRA